MMKVDSNGIVMIAMTMHTKEGPVDPIFWGLQQQCSHVQCFFLLLGPMMTHLQPTVRMVSIALTTPVVTTVSSNSLLSIAASNLAMITIMQCLTQMLHEQ